MDNRLLSGEIQQPENRSVYWQERWGTYYHYHIEVKRGDADSWQSARSVIEGAGFDSPSTYKDRYAALKVFDVCKASWPDYWWRIVTEDRSWTITHYRPHTN